MTATKTNGEGLYSESEIELYLDQARRDFQSGAAVLRREKDSAILFGNCHDRYRIFQVRVTALAAELLSMVAQGVRFAALKRALTEAGMSEGDAIDQLANVAAIARFDRDTLAISYGVIEEVLSAPLNITWDITNTCNLTCAYCLNSSGPVVDRGLTADQCLDVVDQIHDLGTYNVWIGGGEPLVKPGIERVLRRFKEYNIKVLLATNGILVKKPKVLDLIGETCTEVNISIDGHTQELHSSLRGASAKLQDAVDAVRRIKDRYGKDMWVTALTVIHRGNLEELPAIIDFCAEVGFDRWTHNELYALGSGATMRQLVLAHTQYDRLYEILTAKEKELRGKMVVEDYVRMHKVTEPGAVKPFYGCVAGNQEIAIQDNGDVYPCQKLQYEKYYCGNVMQTPLTEMWKTSRVFQWLRSRNIQQTECRGCGIFAAGQCNGGCLAEKEIHFQRHDTRDPLCPENRGTYEKVLRGEIEYPYASHPVDETIGPNDLVAGVWRPNAEA
ncbi:MAG TPA: radical SAM protein [Thermoanaerobaculia bacterium]|jgi:radical SAM protein with 4Fe4S-binding SPASM domain